jgi:hypothetical protein
MQSRRFPAMALLKGAGLPQNAFCGATLGGDMDMIPFRKFEVEV